MAFENELESYLHKWLADQSKKISESILDGSCKSFDEYKERCGKLRALWEVDDQINAARRQRNNPNQEEADNA